MGIVDSLAILVVALGSSVLLAQDAKLQFEVASVRPNKSLDCQGKWDFTQSHGKLSVENFSLRKLISRAHGLTEVEWTPFLRQPVNP
jgi:hypothetical protein